VAWLLSTENLNEAQLQAAAERFKAGEDLRPSEKMLSRARRALGRAFSSDPGLTGPERLGLLAVTLVLTPLVAWICWFWWLQDRPRAAWQAFGLALPASLLFFSLGLAWRVWSRG